jgi:hypothetical protein
MPQPTENFTVACPRCGKRYVVPPSAIGKTATCKCSKQFVVAVPEEDIDDEDGGDYGVSAPPEPPAPAAPPPKPAPKVPQCKRHPGAAVVAACARCHSFLCAACNRNQPGGVHLCPDCAQA